MIGSPTLCTVASVTFPESDVLLAGPPVLRSAWQVCCAKQGRDGGGWRVQQTCLHAKPMRCFRRMRRWTMGAHPDKSFVILPSPVVDRPRTKSASNRDAVSVGLTSVKRWQPVQRGRASPIPDLPKSAHHLRPSVLIRRGRDQREDSVGAIFEETAWCVADRRFPVVRPLGRRLAEGERTRR